MESMIGCSGFNYGNWVGKFYPKAPTLEFYASKMYAVEINMTFYRIPTKKTTASWFTRTDPDFSFILKGPRLLTHTYRLADREKVVNTVDWFYDVASELQHKLKCVLWQFPPSYRYRPENFDRIKRFCDIIANRFPTSAFEFRHGSWLESSVIDHLSGRNFEYVRSDHAHFNCMGVMDTGASYSYIRLHGPRGDCRGSYTNKALRSIADVYLTKRTNFVFFNNDIDVGAPFNAMYLESLMNR